MEVCPDDGARLIATDLEDQVDPLIGTVFDGRFQIEKKLGEGGMGTVYSAQRLDFETTVALKLLKLDFARDDGIRKRFMYEARVISNLKHPHAVRLFDFGQTAEGHVYMVMELLEGESLAERLAYRFVSYREIFDVIPPICGVLGEAHTRDVIHRDLKPENIFLLEVDGNEEFPKLLDFGIAKHKREETMTKSGTLWGTPAYMSPEQAQGNPVGAAADIYGIGIMIFELISGNLPFHASTQMGYAVKHINEPIRPLSSIPGLNSVPDELDDFLVRMLAKDPGERPESMDVVASTLTQICEDHFDDELLDSVPAKEVDPIGLQRWMKESPDVPDQSEEGLDETAKVTAAMLAEANDGNLTPDSARAHETRDVSQMETLAATLDDGVASRSDTDPASEQDSEIAIDSAVEADSDHRSGGKNLPISVLVGVAAMVVVAIVVVAMIAIDAGQEPEEVEPSTAVAADTEEPVLEGAPSDPVDLSGAAAVGSSQALAVVFQAYGIVQQMEPEEIGEIEDDFDFLYDGPAQEEGEEPEDEEQPSLREALERTF